MSIWNTLLGGAGDLVSGLFGESSADKANKANIKLSREQRAWEEKMSDSAVRRRAEDIRLAGGNPVLAFTGGQSASTPSVSAPTVEPTFRPEWTKGSAAGAILQRAQLDNLKADTEQKRADAVSKGVDSRIKVASEQSATDRTINRNIEEYEWDDLTTKIMRNQSISTAAEAQRAEKTTEDMIAIIKQQRESGRYNLNAIKNAGDMNDTAFGRILPYIQAILGIANTGSGIISRFPRGHSEEFTSDTYDMPYGKRTETYRKKR